MNRPLAWGVGLVVVSGVTLAAFVVTFPANLPLPRSLSLRASQAR